MITNSVPIASQLALLGGPVQLVGGRVRGLTQATVGGETVEALGRLYCDVAFLGTNGLSVGHGLSTPDSDEAAVKRVMARGASPGGAGRFVEGRCHAAGQSRGTQ